MRLQGDKNFWISGNIVNIVQQSLHKNVQNAVLKMELSLCVAIPCKSCAFLHFFGCPKQISCWNSIELCSVYSNRMLIQMIYRWRKHTLWISKADLFWEVKKRITACTSQERLHAVTASFSILHSVHFCEAIATQFLQYCQKFKNYVSLQFHIDRFIKRWEKKGNLLLRRPSC